MARRRRRFGMRRPSVKRHRRRFRRRGRRVRRAIGGGIPAQSLHPFGIAGALP